MSKNIQAFPVVTESGAICNEGMTLLDYFAGQALQGYIASGNSGFDSISVNYIKQHGAAYMYEVAAAMLEAREAALKQTNP